MKVKLLSRLQLLATPWTAAYQVPPSWYFPGKRTGVRCHCLLHKQALGSIIMNKASGSDGIPVELFQILKDDAESATINMSANLENSAVATGLEKVTFHSNPKERQCQRMNKLLHDCPHLTR